MRVFALAAAIAVTPAVAHAHKDASSDKAGNCETLAVASRDGWAQVRGQQGMSGKPLWRITNGVIVTSCGEEWRDEAGRQWLWITYQSSEGPRNGWVAAGLLAETPNPTAKDTGSARRPNAGARRRPVSRYEPRHARRLHLHRERFKPCV